MSNNDYEKLVTVRFSKNDLKALDLIRMKYNIDNNSDLIRSALYYYLNHLEEGKTDRKSLIQKETLGQYFRGINDIADENQAKLIDFVCKN